MRTLHLVGLPHAHVSRAVTVCAFTTKTAKFLSMMRQRGWDIILYGGERSHVEDGVELVSLYTHAEQIEWYGDHDANLLPIIAGSWNSTDFSYRTINARAIGEISVRHKRGDIVLLTGGLAMKPIYEALPQALVVEWAAGYSGVLFSDKSMATTPWVCFESNAWQHYMYGKWGIEDGRFFDTVIPNFFDPDEFSIPDKDGPVDDYLLFVGRFIARKGPHIAAEIAREMGMRLLVAGPGVAQHSEGLVVGHDGTRIEGDVSYVGTLGVKERNELMGNARALLVPTTYIEPFGGVAVEAQFAGTPAVATDFGAFTETVPDELRFGTLAEGCEAVERALLLDPQEIRTRAIERYSLEAVAPQFDAWFERLATLWEAGWYEKRKVAA